MAKVLGLGGFFFKFADIDATKAWYARVLGLDIGDHGSVMFSQSGAADVFGRGAMTIWSPFKPDDPYFAPSSENHMINFMVDDLEGVLAKCAEQGVDEVKPREEHPYGHFGWIMDPDGRLIELWQPVEPPASN